MNKIFVKALAAFAGFLLIGCAPASTPVSDPPSAPAPTPTPAKPQIIYKGTGLTQGYDMGVDTSDGLRNWVADMHDSICMNYPGNQAWGAVFITFGKPVPPAERPGQDLSSFQTLSMELKGDKGGEYLSIGIKDKLDPDDGTERKYNVKVTNDWKSYLFPLSDFDTADLTQIYVLTEFVFEPDTPAENVCFRNIEYLP